MPVCSIYFYMGNNCRLNPIYRANWNSLVLNWLQNQSTHHIGVTTSLIDFVSNWTSSHSVSISIYELCDFVVCRIPCDPEHSPPHYLSMFHLTSTARTGWMAGRLCVASAQILYKKSCFGLYFLIVCAFKWGRHRLYHLRWKFSPIETQYSQCEHKERLKQFGLIRMVHSQVLLYLLCFTLIQFWMPPFH